MREADRSPRLSDYNVVWKSPSGDAAGSMPIANGDISANVWAQEDGTLAMFIGKTDSWSENCQLFKLGKVEIRFSPNIFACGGFSQILDLETATIRIEAGGARIRIWADANHPAINIEAESDTPISAEVYTRIWRTCDRAMNFEQKQKTDIISDAGQSEEGLLLSGYNALITADTVAPISKRVPGSLLWYHRNKYSIWKYELEFEGVGGFADIGADPLENRTFGVFAKGHGFENRSDICIATPGLVNKFALSLFALTEQTPDEEAFVRDIVSLSEGYNPSGSYQAHKSWWKAFWERSFIRIIGEEGSDAFTLSQTWHLQRFLTAGAGRGAFPQKFNGSIYNVDSNHKVPCNYCQGPYTADFRGWGGAYWHQNQRQVYWPMLASGDFEVMEPFYRMYLNALPLAEYVTRTWFGHEGAFFPETMHFWGTYTITDYRPVPASLREKPNEAGNPYVRWHWQGGIETLAMMLTQYLYTKDAEFARTFVVPFAQAIISFYDRHYPRESNGTIRFEPAQALETLHDVVNPTPEIAGLNYVLTQLLSLPEDIVGQEQRREWSRVLSQLPPLPFRERDGKRYLAACQTNKAEGDSNMENVAMYAVFPYRLFGVGKPGLEDMVFTFKSREYRTRYSCWHNDNVFAAYLGLADEAVRQLADRCRLNDGYRFPVMFKDGDWTPDSDNGGVIQQALQAMLLQCDGRSIHLLPAWPKDWDVDFRLRAYDNTEVECSVRGGRVEKLRVAPESRLSDVVLHI